MKLYNFRAKGYEYSFANEDKARARENTIICNYRRLSGFYSIPEDRQFWGLSAKQTLDNNSERVQLVYAGLIAPKQYNGVDRDANKIDQNRQLFPDSFWHCGEWIRVIENHNNFRPAIVYFDTLNIANTRKVCSDTIRTMYICPIATLLVVNIMLNNPYEGSWHSVDEFIQGIQNDITGFEARKWVEEKKFYTYKSTNMRTTMATVWFWKRG